MSGPARQGALDRIFYLRVELSTLGHMLCGLCVVGGLGGVSVLYLLSQGEWKYWKMDSL